MTSLISTLARAGLDYRFLLDDYERQPFIQGLGVSIEIIYFHDDRERRGGHFRVDQTVRATAW